MILLFNVMIKMIVKVKILSILNCNIQVKYFFKFCLSFLKLIQIYFFVKNYVKTSKKVDK